MIIDPSAILVATVLILFVASALAAAFLRMTERPRQ